LLWYLTISKIHNYWFRTMVFGNDFLRIHSMSCVKVIDITVESILYSRKSAVFWYKIKQKKQSFEHWKKIEDYDGEN
jgi:hypothetical protein